MIFNLSLYSTCLDFQTSGKIQLSDYGGSLAIRGLCHSNVGRGEQQVSGMKNFHKPEWFATNKKALTRYSKVRFGYSLGYVRLG